MRTLHGITTDRFPNLLDGRRQSAFRRGGQLPCTCSTSRPPTSPTSSRKRSARDLKTIEPASDAVDEYTEVIRSGSANKTLLSFYSSCTPGYYNGESKASKADDLFFGNR